MKYKCSDIIEAIKGDEVDGACSMHERDKKYNIWVRKFDGYRCRCRWKGSIKEIVCEDLDWIHLSSGRLL
jgi:hypothetical protein